MSWQPSSAVRTLHAGDELFVGAWECPGERRAWAREVTGHVGLELQREGAHLRELRGDRVVVDVTTAMLTAANDEYAMASPTAVRQRSTVLQLRGGLADELLPAVPARTGRVSSAAARLHLRLIRAGDPLDLVETALALVHQIRVDAGGADAGEPAVRASWRRLALRAREVVAARFAEHLTLDDIAAACACSTFHLSRVFRATQGETLHRHLTRVRLRNALFQLERSRGRLTELALRAGFASHSHFTTAFRAEFGCAPSCLA